MERVKRARRKEWKTRIGKKRADIFGWGGATKMKLFSSIHGRHENSGCMSGKIGKNPITSQTWSRLRRKVFEDTLAKFYSVWKVSSKRCYFFRFLTISGVEAPSVCDVESALLPLVVSPGIPPAFPSVADPGVPLPSRSSMTRSIGILPFRQLMYRWQKLSQSSWTWKDKEKSKWDTWGKWPNVSGWRETRSFPACLSVCQA